MHYTYLIINEKGNNYAGYTNDIERRLLEHNNLHCNSHKYTKRVGGVWRLVYSEEFQTEKEARLRERFFKSGKGRLFLKDKLK